MSLVYIHSNKKPNYLIKSYLEHVKSDGFDIFNFFFSFGAYMHIIREIFHISFIVMLLNILLEIP